MTAEPDASSLSLDELLGHAAWVRALARNLVSDPNVAEDAVQDTWLAAVKSPPRSGENPRGWLATVLRNALRMRARSGGRRAAHEALAARDEELDGERLAERVETQRRLAAAVLRLGEPARATVILRYYEGLSAAEIARRTNVPAGTVRWRLSQALAELRGRLDDDFGGDRAAWMALVLPLASGSVGGGALQAPAASGSSTPSGAMSPGGATSPANATAATATGLFQGFLAMNLFLKLTVAAGLAALLFTIAFVGTTLGTSMRKAEPARAAVAFRPLVPDAPGSASQAPSTELAGAGLDPRRAAAAPADAAEAGASFEVRLRVVDVRGVPVAGVEVRAERARDLPKPATGADGEPPVRTGADGRAVLTVGFAPDVPLDRAPRVTVVCDHPAYVLGEVEAQLDADRALELGDVRLTAAGAIAGVVRGADGAPVEGAWVDWDPASRAAHDLDRSRVEHSVRGYYGPVRTDADGRFALARVPAGDVYVWAGIDGALAARSGLVEVRGGMESGGVELALGVLDRDDLIEGVVLDPRGAPVPRARIDYDYTRLFGHGSGSTTADADGRFVLVARSRGSWDVSARDPDARFTSVRVEDVEGGARLELRLTAPELMTVAVRVAGEAVDDLTALPGLSIAAFNPKHTRVLVFGDGVELAGGTARVPIPNEEFVLEISADGCEERELGPFDGLAAPRELAVDLRRIPGVRGRVLADGAPVEGAAVLLIGRARNHTILNGFPVRIDANPPVDQKRTDADGAFALDLRAAAEVYVRAEADGFAPAELGPFDVTPERGLDGLVFELTQGGALEGYVVPAAPGLVVGVSRGDGRPRSTRTDAQGYYRFELLTPGPWHVVRLAQELSPYSSSSESSSAPFRESDLAFDCTVSEGKTTRFDLATPAELEARVHGSLLCDGAGPEGHVASLVRSSEGGAGIAAVETSAPVRPDGTFDLAVKRPGRYRMSIARTDGAGATFLAVLDLAPGDNAWEASFATGTLRVTGARPAVGGRIALDYLRAERDGVLVLVGLALPDGADAAQPFEMAGVPAVAGELVRFELAQLLGDADPRSDGVLLGRVTLPAGGVIDVGLEE